MSKKSFRALAATIKSAIDHYCVKHFDEGPRWHLGASEIGHVCERYLWLKFRWTFHKVSDGRQYRLFNRGHREEERFVQWLEGAGFIIYPTDPDTGDQFRISGVMGHFGGSLDGIGYFPESLETMKGIVELADCGLNLESPILYEFKTNGTGSSFSNLTANGCEIEKAQHFDQQCVYGYKMGLTHSLYLNTNKNDDDIYVEIIELDHERGKALEEKAERIILAEAPPAKISQNPAYDKCKYCDAKDVCHLGAPALVNCRSCKYSQPMDGGEWFCMGYQRLIPREIVKTGCENWASLI